MEISHLRGFLGEENIKMHVGYMKSLKHMYSINEKSIPEIRGKRMEQIAGLGLSRRLVSELLALGSEIKLHECYFSSFASVPSASKLLRKHYGSENSFCYELLGVAKGASGGFLCVFLDSRGRPVPRLVAPTGLKIGENPILALDLQEHAYFLDYGFKREEYLRASISYLNIAKLQ